MLLFYFSSFFAPIFFFTPCNALLSFFFQNCRDRTLPIFFPSPQAYCVSSIHFPTEPIISLSSCFLAQIPHLRQADSPPQTMARLCQSRHQSHHLPQLSWQPPTSLGTYFLLCLFPPLFYLPLKRFSLYLSISPPPAFFVFILPVQLRTYHKTDRLLN